MTTVLTKEQQIDLAWAQHRAPVLARGVGLTAELRNQLCEQQNWRCCYCGIRMDGAGDDTNAPSFEHIVPRSVGGTNELSNIVIACRQCNTARGSENLDIHLLAKGGDVHAWFTDANGAVVKQSSGHGARAGGSETGGAAAMSMSEYDIRFDLLGVPLTVDGQPLLIPQEALSPQRTLVRNGWTNDVRGNAHDPGGSRMTARPVRVA